MSDNNKLETISNLFEGKEIRSIWDAEKEEYFLVKEGSITIKENEVQFGVKTQNGSKIKGKYNGELYIERDMVYDVSQFSIQKLQKDKIKNRLENNIVNLQKR